MKLTIKQLKQIIKEELGAMQKASLGRFITKHIKSANEEIIEVLHKATIGIHGEEFMNSRITRLVDEFIGDVMDDFVLADMKTSTARYDDEYHSQLFNTIKSHPHTTQWLNTVNEMKEFAMRMISIKQNPELAVDELDHDLLKVASGVGPESFAQAYELAASLL